MQIFFRCKSRCEEIYLKKDEIIGYEYKSTTNVCRKSFDVKFVFNFANSKKNLLEFLKGWVYQNHAHEDFYREIAFGFIFDDKEIKEITFFDAYVGSSNEICDAQGKVTILSLYVRQKENKLESVKISPISNTKKVKIEHIYKKDLEDDFVSSENEYEMEVDNVKLFKEKMDRQEKMIDEYKQVLVKKFESAPKHVQNVFLKYVPDNSAEFVHLKFMSHRVDDCDLVLNETNQKAAYEPVQRRVKMNIMDDLVHRFATPGAIYFHEHGHLIDYTNIDKDGYGEYLLSSDKKFAYLLKKDFQDYINKYARKSSVFMYTKDIYREISMRLEEDTKYYIVSDLYGAISKGMCQGNYAHSQKYWQRDPELIQVEAIANFFEAQFDPEVLETLKEFFPKSLARFEEMLKMIDENGEISQDKKNSKEDIKDIDAKENIKNNQDDLTVDTNSINITEHTVDTQNMENVINTKDEDHIINKAKSKGIKRKKCAIQ